MQTETPAAIYVRVSTDEQAREGTSLDVQRERCRAFIVSKGWTIVGEYADDGVSGTKASRPALDRLMEDCRAGIVKAVVFSKFDRFSRNRRHLENTAAELDDLGVALVSVSENIDGSTATGQAFRALLGVFANLERDMIVERMNSGLRAVAEANYWPGAQAPYGFRIEKEGSRSKLVLDELEADYLRQAISLLVDDGMSTLQVANRLNALGFKPRRTARWTHQNLRRTLLESSLSGTWTWSRQRGNRKPKQQSITLSIPAIISEERHAELKRTLAKTSITRSKPPLYPLSSGRIVAMCGSSYHGVIHHGSIRQYKCYGRMYGRDDRCTCARLNAEMIEGAAWTAISELLTDKARLTSMAEDFQAQQRKRVPQNNHDQLISSIRKRITSLQNGLSRAYADRYTGEGDTSAIDAAVKHMEQELRGLQRQLLQEGALHEQTSLNPSDLVSLMASVGRRLAQMSTEQRATVFDLLNVKLKVREWRRCSTCYGRGKVSGARGGVSCPSCAGMRQHPVLDLEGRIPARPGRFPVANVGDNANGALKRCPCC